MLRVVVIANIVGICISTILSLIPTEVVTRVGHILHVTYNPAVIISFFLFLILIFLRYRRCVGWQKTLAILALVASVFGVLQGIWTYVPSLIWSTHRETVFTLSRWMMHTSALRTLVMFFFYALLWRHVPRSQTSVFDLKVASGLMGLNSLVGLLLFQVTWWDALNLIRDWVLRGPQSIKIIGLISGLIEAYFFIAVLMRLRDRDGELL